jgi:hypothetical protein
LQGIHSPCNISEVFMLTITQSSNLIAREKEK